MSDYLNWLRQGSAGHVVKVKGRTVQVTPRDDSIEALSDFQSVAEEVMRRSFEGEFEAKPHQTRRWSIPGRAEDPYDLVVVWPSDD